MHWKGQPLLSYETVIALIGGGIGAYLVMRGAKPPTPQPVDPTKETTQIAIADAKAAEARAKAAALGGPVFCTNTAYFATLRYWRAEQIGNGAHEADRRIAHADDVYPGVTGDGVLDVAARVGQIDQQRVRRHLFDEAAMLKRYRDGAQRIVHAARPVGLLARQSEDVIDAFVLEALHDEARDVLAGRSHGESVAGSPTSLWSAE